MDTINTENKNDGWQPMDTAPMDATKILVAVPSGHVYIAFRDHSSDEWLDANDSCCIDGIYAWLPLPEPPPLPTEKEGKK